MFDGLERATKQNVAFGFVLEHKEDGSCRDSYAHETTTLLERSKIVATTEDLTKIRNLSSNTDVIQSCTRERANTKLKLYQLTNVTINAALLKEVPIGCKDTFMPEPLLKNHSVKCLTFGESTRKP